MADSPLALNDPIYNPLSLLGVGGTNYATTPADSAAGTDQLNSLYNTVGLAGFGQSPYITGAPLQTAASQQAATAAQTPTPPTPDPNAPYWSAQNTLLNQQLDALPGQLQSGNTNVQNAYNNAYQQLLNNQTIANRNYGTAQTQAQQGLQTAQGNIDTGVRQQLTGLQRLLGMHGAGSSSASSILGPYAAGLQGAQERGQVQQTYGQNMSNLDTANADTQNQFTNSFGDLAAQRDAQLQAKQVAFDQSKASLLGQQATNASQSGAPTQGYLDQIQALLGQIGSLGVTPTFTPKAVTATTPNLAQYDYTKAAAPTQGPLATASAAITPYSYLLGNQQKNLAGQNLVGASA